MTWFWDWWSWLLKPDPRPHSPDESHARNIGWSGHDEDFDEVTDEQVAALRKMIEELKKHEHD